MKGRGERRKDLVRYDIASGEEERFGILVAIGGNGIANRTAKVAVNACG